MHFLFTGFDILFEHIRRSNNRRLHLIIEAPLRVKDSKLLCQPSAMISAVRQLNESQVIELPKSESGKKKQDGK